MIKMALFFILLACITQSSFEKNQEHDKKPILKHFRNQSSMPLPMLKWNNRLYKITIN